MNKKIILVSILLFLPFSLFSETIILKSGKKIEAEIIKKSNDYIKIDFHGVLLTYYLDDIVSIDEGYIKSDTLSSSHISATKMPYYNHIDEILNTPEKDIDLTKAVLLAYKTWDLSIDTTKYFNQIDSMTNDIKTKIDSANISAPKDIALFISRYLFQNLSLSPIIQDNMLRMSQIEHDTMGKTQFLTYLLDEKKGSCMNFSLLHLAIAERLNFSLFLVSAPQHLFVRYDDGIEKFNIETLLEAKIVDDSFYIEWKKISSGIIKKGIYLRNLSKKETIGIVLEDLARFYSEINNDDMAIAIIDKSLQFYPNNIEALTKKGALYLRKYAHLAKQYDKFDSFLLESAIEFFQRSLEANPDYIDALINLGTALMLKQKNDVAMEQFNKVLSIQPGYGPAYQRLAALHSLAERYDLAWEYAIKAKDSGWPIPNNTFEDIKKNRGK